MFRASEGTKKDVRMQKMFQSACFPLHNCWFVNYTLSQTHKLRSIILEMIWDGDQQ